jgi:hypothetical protein
MAQMLALRWRISITRYRLKIAWGTCHVARGNNRQREQ